VLDPNYKFLIGISGPIFCGITPLKTNMTIETPPFEDVFSIENGDFPMSC